MESEDQIAELCGELAKIQEALTELCPDMEKLETNFSVLAIFNIKLVDVS